jgi:hypothetical protein
MHTLTTEREEYGRSFLPERTIAWISAIVTRPAVLRMAGLAEAALVVAVQ